MGIYTGVSMHDCCRCRHCGWLVPATGVTIAAEHDIAYDERAGERCEDACESRAVCDAHGREVVS